MFDWIYMIFGNLVSFAGYVGSCALLIGLFVWNTRRFQEGAEAGPDDRKHHLDTPRNKRKTSFINAALLCALMAVLCFGLERIPWRALFVFAIAFVLIAFLRHALNLFLGLSTIDAQKRQKTMIKLGAPILFGGVVGLSGIGVMLLLVLAVVANLIRQVVGVGEDSDIAQFVWLLLFPQALISVVLYVTSAIVMLRPTIDKVVRARFFMVMTFAPISLVVTWAAILAEFPVVDFSTAKYWYIPDDAMVLTWFSIALVGVPIIVLFIANLAYSAQRNDFLDRLSRFADRMEFASTPHKSAELGQTITNDVLVQVPRLLGELLDGDNYLLIYWFKRFPKIARGINKQVNTFHFETVGDPSPTTDEDIVLNPDGSPVTAGHNLPAPTERTLGAVQNDVFARDSMYREDTLQERMQTERLEAFFFLIDQQNTLKVLHNNPSLDALFNREQHAIRRWNYRAIFVEGLTEIMMDPFNADLMEDVIEVFRAEVAVRKGDRSDSFRKLLATSGAGAVFTLVIPLAERLMSL